MKINIIFRKVINTLIKFLNIFLPRTERIYTVPPFPFKIDRSLEKIVWEYALTKSTTIAEIIGGDGRDGEKFKFAEKICSEIKEKHRDKLSEYLEPYFNLSMSDVDHVAEWHRWYSANDFKK